MGKFGNTWRDEVRQEMEREQYCRENDIPYEPPAFSVGTYLGPRPRDLTPPTMDHGKSGWEALGLPVPFFRRSAGIRALRDMGFTDRERMDEIVGRMCSHVEHDDSHMAMEDALGMGVDVTGCYRLLATLLCAEKPAPPPPAEPTYLDLVQP